MHSWVTEEISCGRQRGTQRRRAWGGGDPASKPKQFVYFPTDRSFPGEQRLLNDEETRGRPSPGRDNKSHTGTQEHRKSIKVMCFI